VDDDEGDDGHANFPEYQNVYIEPYAYEAYKTGVFPDGTIFKELQLTLPGQNPMARAPSRAGATCQALPLHPMKAAADATADAAS
jgi:hypothetical protein